MLASLNMNDVRVMLYAIPSRNALAIVLRGTGVVVVSVCGDTAWCFSVWIRSLARCVLCLRSGCFSCLLALLFVGLGLWLLTCHHSRVCGHSVLEAV